MDHNTIITAGHYLEIGIGQGPSVWWAQSTRQVIRGAFVTNNLITRDLRHIHGPVAKDQEQERLGNGSIGYGFPVGSDVADWVCMGNVSDPSVQSSGDISSTLDPPPGYLNAPPGPFIHDRWGNSEGDEADLSSLMLQNEFKEGKVWGLIAVKPGQPKVVAFNGGNELRARLDHKIDLSGGIGIYLRPDDAELCVVQHSEGGRVLWQAGVSGNINPHRPNFHNALLSFSRGGKLAIVDSENEDDVWYDFTPHIPKEPKQSHRDNNRPPSQARLVFSSSKPYVRITSPEPENLLLYASSYSYRQQYGFPFGSYVARSVPPSPQNPSGGALIYTMSPQRRFVILYTQRPFHEIDWPLDNNAFQVLHDFGGDPGEDDRKCILFFQGDGNLVSYLTILT